MRTRFILPILLLGSLSQPALAATDAPRGRFGGAVEVRVVNVEAVVTDRDGSRVDGLGPADFRLLVDGREVAIDYFTEIREGDLAPAAESATAAAGPPAAGDLETGDPVPTNYLVFLDEYFPLPIDRDRAVRALIDGLPRLGPSDSMQVVAFDGRRLARLVDWTSDHDQLQATLAAATERPTGGFQRRFEQRGIGSSLEVRQLLHRLSYQVESALAAAGSAMRASQPPAGRKVMLVLAGGWPADPSMLLPVTEYTHAEQHDLTATREKFNELADVANLLGYTIYPVDMPGLEGGGLPDASSASSGGSEAALTSSYEIDPGRDDEPDLDPVPGTLTRVGRTSPFPYERERQNEAGLRVLASETGGRALINAGVSEALELTAADTRSYYWLGFTADAGRDDAQHEIVVEVTRPDLKVRTRSGFVDLSPERETTMLVESALLFADGSEQDALEVTLGTPHRHGVRKVQVPVEVRIPIGAMMAVASDAGYDVHLELRIGALDGNGYPSDIPVIPVVFSGPAAPAPGSYGTYSGTLELRRGTRNLLVAAYDPALDKLLATRLDVEF